MLPWGVRPFPASRQHTLNSETELSAHANNKASALADEFAPSSLNWPDAAALELFRWAGLKFTAGDRWCSSLLGSAICSNTHLTQGGAMTLRQRHSMTPGNPIDARARHKAKLSRRSEAGAEMHSRRGQTAKSASSIRALFLCSAICLFACSSESPQVGSQTNWLAACNNSSECGDYYCICGTCTAPCTEDAACSDLPGSECVSSVETGVVALCGGQTGPSGMCLPRCEDAPCPAGTACMAGVCVADASTSNHVTLDLTLRHQTLIGFGAGIGFVEDALVNHPLSDEVYDTLFVEGGLEALRIRNRFGEGNDSNLEPLASIVGAVSERLGFNPTLFISEGSPPPSLKLNGSLSCLNNLETCTLAQTPEGDFNYAGFADHWRSALEAYAQVGVTFDFLSIQNHPNIIPQGDGGGGDACRFLPQEGTELLTVNDAPVEISYPGYLEALQAVSDALEGFSEAPAISGPDLTGVTSFTGYMETMEGPLDALSIHLYGVSAASLDEATFAPIRAEAEARGVPVVQTEIMVGPRDSALLIHHTLVHASASAYLQNDLIALSDASSEVALLRFTADSFETLPLFDVFAHYARYTDPGWTRIEVDAENVLASAWLAPDESALTIVLQNPGDTDTAARLNIPAELADVLTHSEIVRTVFDGMERLTNLGALSPGGVVRLPAGSILTVALTAP
jgi:hypothetical protein